MPNERVSKHPMYLGCSKHMEHLIQPSEVTGDVMCEWVIRISQNMGLVLAW